MQHLKIYNKQDILSLTRLRRFETKIGERLQVISDAKNIEQSIAQSNAKFVLAGVPEDIGVKADLGLGGADTAWVPFLEAFFKIQSNDFFEGSEVLVAGHFDFSQLANLNENNAQTQEEKIEAYRHAITTVDDEV